MKLKARPALPIGLIFVSTFAYLALPILLFGGIRPFLANPARAALALATLLLAGISLFSRGNLSPGEREDRGNRWVVLAFGLIGVLDGFLPALCDRWNFWVVDGEGVRWVGVVLYVGGGALRIWPVFVLGRRFSGLVAIQPEHKLVTSGPYRYLRHPSYLGLLVYVLGWGLAFRSWAGVVLAGLLLPPLLARIAAEERLLRSKFGAEYDAYRSRTARMIPGIY
ncbi:isoprenylcysteine carboxylmethyltransferase family protein [Verrucomicrobium sp. 3C]|uniref:methyltransferase family protein n=1 Tax=Verrucomicrobium sp. 3C TaxID=1134055 RepID=UPI00037086DF|nr:isoprenylcysteine carboxylmethyltransferase family protein [Verrucomicrobium sp. 3C]